MRGLLVAVCLVVAGCAKGGGSADGGVEAVPVAVWVDSTGAVVGPVTGATPSYFDAAGNVWALDAESAQVVVAPAATTTIPYVLFGDATCSTAQFIIGPQVFPPRQVFTGLDGGSFSRNPTARSAPLPSGDHYSLNSGTCSTSTAAQVAAFSAADVSVAALPSLAFSPPIHVESR